MSASSAAAPAIPVKTLLPHLVHHCLSDLTARILEHDETFPGLQFRCHQICYVHNLVTSVLNIPISISALARGFGCKRDRVTSALAHGLESPESGDRHLEMDEDRERQPLACISQHAAKSTPMARCDLREQVTTKYDLPTTRGWVNSLSVATSRKYAK
jgi:hypothetical protein